MTATDIESSLRELCVHGEFERATTLALDAYGAELMRFLSARLGSQRAQDAFSVFLEDLWSGLPDFAWRSSLRTWLYVIARHVAARELRGARNRYERTDTNSIISALAARARTETPAHLKTDAKSRFRALRAQLPEDDQTLLILRIDSQLSWKDLARVMLDSTDAPGEAELEVMAVRLRQRFHAAKNRLRKLAESEGLLES